MCSWCQASIHYSAWRRYCPYPSTDRPLSRLSWEGSDHCTMSSYPAATSTCSGLRFVFSWGWKLAVPGSLGLWSNIGCCNSNTVYYYSLNIICSIRCCTHICVIWCAIIRFGLFLVIYQNVMYNNIITIPRFCAGWFCPLQIIGRHSSVAFCVWSTFPNLLSSISLPGHTLRW